MKKNNKNKKNKKSNKINQKNHLYKALSSGRNTKARNNVYKKSRGKTAEGIFRASRHGYGFVYCESFSGDVFIPAKYTKNAFDDDKVRISYRLDPKKGSFEGEIIEITEFSRKTVIGTLFSVRVGRNNRKNGNLRSSDRYFVIADNSRLPDEIDVIPGPDDFEGDKVEVVLDRKSRKGFCGDIIRNFGPAESKEANYNAILSENGIEIEFGAEALSFAETQAGRELSFEQRSDLTKETIFTIDGAGAKDLDDAVSVQKNGKDYILGVHIADVSEYVPAKTPLDREAMLRGTSVYFADKVVPMLPPALSNRACSLNAGEKKYALTARIHISEDGKILKTDIEKSIIISKVRGVYSEVNDLLERGKSSEFFSKYEGVYDSLKTMYRLYRILKKRSKARGAMELDRAEAEILLDEDGLPVNIVKRTRGEAEQLIEQFMLAANEGVATLMQEKGIPCVYRIHEAPDPEKTKNFIEFAYNQGFDVSGLSEKMSGKDFENILDAARKTDKSDAISYVILRTMSKARYSEINSGHFGLGIEKYCHFTSPIRRLSDLATHRIIKAVLLGKEIPERYRGYARRAAVSASEAELRALSAERAIDDLYKCIFMEKFIGQDFDAIVTMVTSFGIFAELDNTCEGMIIISELGETAVYDERSLSVYTGDNKISIGDKIKVKVEKTDIVTRKITFSLSSLSKKI